MEEDIMLMSEKAASEKAYIQSLQDKEGNAVYPITTADAVYLQEKDQDGTIKQQTVSAKLKSMETSFQAGVEALVSRLTDLGFAPENSTPDGVAAAIQKMYEDRYNSGRAQGQADVKADPGAYGLITTEQYNTYGDQRYNAGVADADARVNGSSASYKAGYNAGVPAGKNAAYAQVSTSCSWSGDNKGDYGTRAATSGSASATATLQNGRLTIAISGQSSGTGWRWINSDWKDQISTSGSGNKSNAANVS